MIFLKPTIKTSKTFKFGQKGDMSRNMSDQVCRCCLHSVTHWTHSTRRRVRLPQGETIESKSHLHFSPFFLHICLRAACHIKFNTYLHAAFHILYGCWLFSTFAASVGRNKCVSLQRADTPNSYQKIKQIVSPLTQMSTPNTS